MGWREWLGRYRFSIVELVAIGEATHLILGGRWLPGIAVAFAGAIAQAILESTRP